MTDADEFEITHELNRKERNMKLKTGIRTGWILMLCGLLGVGISAAEKMAIFSGETIESASALAEAISGTLIPATIGVLLAFVGLIMVMLGWWRVRPQNQKHGQ